MSYRSENNLEQQVSLKYFLSEVLDKWYIILLVTLISVAIQFIDAKYFTTPTYDSTAKIYIMNKQSESVSSADISISTYLAKDYEELIKDKVILEEVSQRLGGVYSAKQLRRCLAINNPESTRILEITVRTGNANTSKKIADCICQVAQEKIVELLGIDRVTVLGEGDLNTRPSSPNIKNRVLLGLLIGMAVSLVSIAFFCFSNSKIKTEQDVNNMLNLSVLATIPYSKKNTK